MDANFSDDRNHRYLWRDVWEPSKLCCLFIMLNPSKADETSTDDTIDTCIAHAKDWGCGGLYVANLFALVSTASGYLLNVLRQGSVAYAVGPQNDKVLQELASAEGIGLVVAAWGANVDKNQAAKERASAVRAMFTSRLCALGVTESGEPKHPIA